MPILNNITALTFRIGILLNEGSTKLGGLYV